MPEQSEPKCSGNRNFDCRILDDFVREAAYRGNIKWLELLVKEGADVNKADNIGGTPLMKSVCGNQKDCLQILLKAGADVNRIDDRGFSALVYAAEKDVNYIDMLLEAGADVNAHSEYSESALMVASQRGNVNCVTKVTRSRS